MDFLLELVVIFLACIMADVVMRTYDHFSKKRLDIGCDYCEEAKKTYRTQDKMYWLCKQCLEAYVRENQE